MMILIFLSYLCKKFELVMNEFDFSLPFPEVRRLFNKRWVIVYDGRMISLTRLAIDYPHVFMLLERKVSRSRLSRYNKLEFDHYPVFSFCRKPLKLIPR